MQGCNSVDQRQRAARRRGTLDNLCYNPTRTATQVHRMFKFSNRSKQHLMSVHPNLAHVVERALELAAGSAA